MQSVSIEFLIAENAIDRDENPTYDDVGLLGLSAQIPVKEAAPSFLRTLLAYQGRGKTVWEIRSRARANGTSRIISGWRAAIRRGLRPPADIIIVDSSEGDGSPRLIDGHHRVVAAIHEGVALRFVDIADIG